ncbi:DEP domain-containing protein 1A-like [Diadema antillarum]|uniref:DEP domain-containing protein 1A-like n=1 Tax=Diadema antillarum TaxID=105358 RepID=UPI003A8545E6
MNMDKPKATIGPFRATKLWNTIISDFRSGIPLKRHRWRMRHYDNCFTSAEAVDWLHNYLCNSENFGPWVTRQQVVLLLDKFVQSKIIEEIQTSKVAAAEKASFEDNGHLYKFLPVSPMKKLRSALASRSSIQSLSPSPKVKKSVARTTQGRVTQPLALRDTNVVDVRPAESSGVTKELPRCRLIPRPLTTEQVEEVWKSATLKRLERLLWLSTLDGLLDDSVIVPSDIIHNCTHINRNGVVQLLKKEGDLPHWVLSAMRCLANWPSKIDSELPNYPGFERDVFKTVSNYFQNLSEPLITYSRYNLVIDSFVSMECRDRGIVPGQEVVTVYTGIRGGLTSFQSVESLMLNMTMGGGNLSARASGRKRPAWRDEVGSVAGQRKVRRSTSCGPADLAMQGDTPHLPNNAAGIPRRGLNQRFGSTEVLTHRNTFLHKNYNVYSASAARPQGHRMSNAEDDYGFANMPPLLPPKKSSLAEVSSVSDKSTYGNTGSVPAQVPPRKCSSLSNITEAGKKENLPKQKWGSGLFASKRFGSAAELFGRLVKKKSSSYRELSKDSAEFGDKEAPAERVTSSNQIVSPGLAPPPAYPVYNLSPIEGSSREAREATLHSHTDDSTKVSPPYPAPIRATLSYSAISSGQQSFVTPSVHQAEMTPSGMPSAIVGSVRCSRSLSNLQTSTPMYENLAQTAQRRLRRQDSVNSISSLYLSEDKSYCLEALRLCLLLLPPPQRRALHLLLRLMSKMENNAELVLSANVSTRRLLLNTFTRSILCCEAEADLDESLAVRIVAYLLDNHASLFTIPQELRQDIEERMMYLKRSQIKYEMDTENVQPAAFCAQVSVEEYEKQKTSSSQKAIEDLLDSIIADRVMPAKEKKKKLKLFQKAYPDIYHRRLPTSSSEAELFPDKPKIKQPMLNVKRSLSKLKPIR